MGFTDVFKLRFMDPSTPLRQLDEVTKSMATTIEAALLNRGSVPSGYTDLIAALAARVSAVEAATTVDTWPVQFANGFSNFGGTYQPSYVTKVGRLAVLHLMIKGGTSPGIVCTLPARFRPAGDVYPPAYVQAGGTNSVASCVIAANGTVTLYGSASGNQSLLVPWLIG